MLSFYPNDENARGYALKKWLWAVAGTIVMLAAVCLCEIIRPAGADLPEQKVHFFVDELDQVNIWRNEKTGDVTVFLPSFADLNTVTVSLDENTSASLDGVRLTSGMTCSGFHLKTPYTLTVDDHPPATLQFLQSEHVASMFIDTLSGNMKKVHSDKKYKEKVHTRLLTADGTLDYENMFNDRIRGHGQSTWRNCRKKSYNLYMDTPTGLLGMTACKKWVLLANAWDPSNLRNKVFLDFARQFGGSWFAPECEFVELYLNGSYNGLYLLCTSVKDTIEDALADSLLYCFDTDMENRVAGTKNSFPVNKGIAAEIIYPDAVSVEQRDYLANQVRLMQDTLLADSEQGQSWDTYINLDSWARKYLVEEVSLNYDAGTTSQYYYMKVSDPKIYAGPCWDYDNTLGAFTVQNNPRCFLTQREWNSSDYYTPWYHALWQHEEFQQLVKQLYRDQVLPVMTTLVEEGIFEEAEQIREAAQNNAIRWNGKSPENAVTQLTDFLKQRLDFLTSAWVDGVDYKTITLKKPLQYKFFCTPVGTVMQDLPTPQEVGIEGETVWYYDGTDRAYDYDTVITEDITLYAKQPEPATEKGGLFSFMNRRQIVAALSVVILLGFLTAAIVVDVSNRSDKKRRKAG